MKKITIEIPDGYSVFQIIRHPAPSFEEINYYTTNLAEIYDVIEKAERDDTGLYVGTGLVIYQMPSDGVKNVYFAVDASAVVDRIKNREAAENEHSQREKEEYEDPYL